MVIMQGRKEKKGGNIGPKKFIVGVPLALHGSGPRKGGGKKTAKRGGMFFG